MSRRVMVVEDTELLRRMYSDRLAQDGFTVIPAADGLDALRILHTETPDLILLDLLMPRMSGVEFLDTIKRDPRLQNIPVVVLSNLGHDDDVKRGLELGAVDYLIKNDSRPADISERITTVLKGASDEPGEARTYALLIRDREADADSFVQQAGLQRRFWCPACEVELVLELIPEAGRAGWYNAHLICPRCSREF